jgi:hypothetical protein
MTNSRLRSPRAAIAVLAAGHGILLTSQRPGTRVYVETTDYCYELTLLDQRSLKVEIVSNDPCIGVRATGFFERSVYDEEGQAALVAWIAAGMRMQIRFANGVLNSRPVVTATICGDGWHYKVF